MQTDILIIGSGGAGLIAACAARDAGLSVTLVTKSRAGLANCTAYAGGGFTLPFGSLSPESHRQKTREIGRFLNVPHMLDALSNEAAASVRRLAKYGVRVEFSDGHASVSRHAPSALMGGGGMTLPLVAYARRSGVRLVESAIVTGIHTDDTGVAGVSAFDYQAGTHFSIGAKAVIVATGGCGRLYSRTDNPVRTTGDGMALLAELGLPFIDMEFVQFYPMGFAEPGFPVWMIGLNFVDKAPVTNSDGERFLENLWREWGIKNGAEANLLTRDRSARAIGREWAKGKKVYLHVEKAPADTWSQGYGRTLMRMFPRGRKPEHGPIMVKPVQHYFPGGVSVEPDSSTEIPGLFACGEVTGGTDGANRIGGNALSMITVFGFRSAESAVRYATHRSSVAREAPDLHPACGLSTRWSMNTTGPTPRELKRMINDVCDERLAVVRTGEGLRSALSDLCDIEQQVGSMAVFSPDDIREAYEARNLVIVGKMVARAAILRTESRGVHYREDYPEEDQNWLKHIEIRLRDGKMETRTFPAV